MITINLRLPHGSTEDYTQQFIAYTKSGAFLQDLDGMNKVTIPAYSILSVILKDGAFSTSMKKDLKLTEPTKFGDYKDSMKLMETLEKNSKEQ
ncbi:hypothetical protein SKA34_07139 [Photobacterium sp. SKA34]|uniref:hypothetical protein n=1 Tax=Photobacterium sp. SKA34 TaxID=121723 RepID=UPI00006B5765|nr:hypothetical protein [Photobacterium sp. SKA34]EAR55137.1 hypothetical protein SKA34_07139 [Photobacterium sp. SKA34]